MQERKKWTKDKQKRQKGKRKEWKASYRTPSRPSNPKVFRVFGKQGVQTGWTSRVFISICISLLLYWKS